MLIRKYRSFLLLTPNVLTGGPEAMHQLARVLLDMGLDARIMVYQDPGTIRIENGVVSHPPLVENAPAIGYIRYRPVYTDRFELGPDTLVILPETRCELAGQLAPSAVAVWWLSTHNGFYIGARIRDDEVYRRWLFASGEVLHFYQTLHARRMLTGFGCHSSYPLVDYTDPRFLRHQLTGPNSGEAIAFNGRKGADHYQPFFAAHPEFTPLPIVNMPKRRVFETLKASRIFVKFGHNPGKDRMPREAASLGAIVVARIDGGSELFEDTPIGPQHKFRNEALTDGSLAKTLRDIAADPQPHWDDQAYYRSYLRTERDLMRVQAVRLFGL
jgi:hypothetical protein